MKTKYQPKAGDVCEWTITANGSALKLWQNSGKIAKILICSRTFIKPMLAAVR